MSTETVLLRNGKTVPALLVRTTMEAVAHLQGQGLTGALAVLDLISYMQGEITVIPREERRLLADAALLEPGTWELQTTTRDILAAALLPGGSFGNPLAPEGTP